MENVADEVDRLIQMARDEHFMLLEVLGVAAPRGVNGPVWRSPGVVAAAVDLSMARPRRGSE